MKDKHRAQSNVSIIHHLVRIIYRLTRMDVLRL